MNCNNCFYQKLCHHCHSYDRFGDPETIVYYYEDAEIHCNSFLNKQLVKILPCPDGTDIWKIEFAWGCGAKHCPLAWGTCTDCSSYGKNKSRVIPTKYHLGITIGDIYFLTKEDAEAKLASMSKKEIKEMCESW